MTQRLTLCSFCKHRHFRQPTCTAYPDGIPDDFRFGRKQHVLPAEGDHAIQFEPAEGQEKSPFVLYMLEVHRAMAPEHSSDTPTPAG